MRSRLTMFVLLAVGLAGAGSAQAQLEETTYRLDQSTDALEVWTTPATCKVFPDAAVPTAGDSQLRVYAARNEFEPFLVVVHPTASQTVTFSVGDFGAGITTEMYQVKYVDVTQPTDGLGRVGQNPDPLWPLDSGGSVSLTAGQNTAFWVTVKVPEGVPAGDVTTNVYVGGLTIPVTLHVFDFTLSPQLNMVAELTLSMNAVVSRYGVPGFGDEFWEYVAIWNQFLIDHRLCPPNPTWPGSVTYGGGAPQINYDCSTRQVSDPDGQWGFEEPAGTYLGGLGFNDGVGFPSFKVIGLSNNDPSSDQRPFEFCLTNRTSADWYTGDNPATSYNQAWFGYLGDLSDYLGELGYLDRSYYHLAAQPLDTADFEAIAWYSRYVDSAAPDLPLLVTSHPRAELYDSDDYLADGQIDIWLTRKECHDPGVALDRLANHGEASWLYFDTGTESPHFNPLTLDHPGMDSALLGWYLWQHRLRGFHHYLGNYWSVNPWTTPAFAGHNGFASLVYPPSQSGSNIDYGANGHRPVPSIRLELLRDGLEDYEYLLALNNGQQPQAGVANPADTQAAKLIAGVTGYNRDDHFRANLRRLMGMKLGGEIAEIPDINPQSSHPRAQGDPGDYYLNFQDPAGEPVVDPLVVGGNQYLKIGSEAYDSTAGYGWYSSVTANWQTAFVAAGPDPLQSSILYSDWGRPAVFEFDLPSGTYEVTVSVGWQGRTYAHQQIEIEGVPLVVDEGDPDYTVRTAEVEVLDSRLTMAMGLPDQYTMLNYLNIEAVDDISGVPETVGIGSGRANLHPARPNPCNPATVISFDLPAAGPLALNVYDLAGRRVRTLIPRQAMAAGEHRAIWRGADDHGQSVAAGVYFYQLDFAGERLTRRVVLVK